MPNLTTHIHFALLFAERTRYDIPLAAFVEGAVAPGLRSESDVFMAPHGMNHAAATDPRMLYKERKESDMDSYGFRLGYLSHCFLDHHFAAYREEIFLFQSPLKKERMRRVSLAEQIDIMHMKEYESDLRRLAEQYGTAFTDLYHTVSVPEDTCMEIAQDYESLMLGLVEKFIQFLKALEAMSASDDFVL